VEKDDIPMQNKRVGNLRRKGLGRRQGVFEKGVSGFKKSAKDRDAIQEIQKDALEHKFDVYWFFSSTGSDAKMMKPHL
jgi:hypothetical protein